MLTLWMVASAVAAGGLGAQETPAASVRAEAPPQAEIKTCPNGSVVRKDERCVKLPDHRTQFSLPPPLMRLTAEWTCGTSGAWPSASAQLAGEPAAGTARKVIYKAARSVQLLSLTVEGPAGVERRC